MAKKTKFIVLDSNTGEFLLKVDLDRCSEYSNDEWQRCIADNLDLQENIIVLFEDDIDYDFYKLHQCLKVYPDGHVEDTRPSKYIYTFYVEKTLADSGKVVNLGKKVYRFDEELSKSDLLELKTSIGANRVEMKYKKIPSDNQLYRLEGKLDLVKKKRIIL